MKHGDLSNEVAPAFGVRFERIIKTEEGKLNKAAKAQLQYMMRAVDCNIYIITTGDKRKAMSFMMKWGVPYNFVIQADSTLEIPDIARENDFMTYFDIDTDILQNVNSRGHGKIAAKQWTLVKV